MGDTVREAAATLASLLNAPANGDDDDSKSAGKKKSSSSASKNSKKDDAQSKQNKKSDINWGAILKNKELGDEWDYYYRRLEIFEQRYKHVRVPRDGKRDDLHDWIKAQKAKAAYLSEDRVLALQMIGVLPSKLSHDIVYSNPPRPPKRRKEDEPVKRKSKPSPATAKKKQKQKEKQEVVNKKRAAETNPYSNVDEDAREKSKASRADRANRRMGDFKIASISPKSPAAETQKAKPKVERKRVAEPNPYSTVDKVAAEKSKVSRADRAERRMGHFRTAFISPR